MHESFPIKIFFDINLTFDQNVSSVPVNTYINKYFRSVMLMFFAKDRTGQDGPCSYTSCGVIVGLCSSVVQWVIRLIPPGRPNDLCLIPAIAPQLVEHRPWYVLS